MNLEIIKQETFPNLSWGAVLNSKTSIITAYVGAGIEVFDDGFIEGCHSGKHILDDVLEAKFCLATGVISKAGSKTFFTPSHTLDPLYIIKVGSLSYISNSLPCVLSLSGQKLDNKYLYYAADFSFIYHHVEKVPLEKGDMEVFYDTNICLGDDLSFLAKPKQHYGSFNNFESYQTALKETIKLCADNAKHADRQFKYQPVSTISSGYDSVAISAVAKEVLKEDINIALTIKDAGKNLGDVHDSGLDTAIKLGYKPIEKARLDYKEDNKNELLFSILGAPQDMSLAVFEEHLKGSLLLRGDHGDVAWSYNIKPKGFKRNEPSGVNSNEYRHHIGFINFPLAFVGIENHADLIRIAKSDEMAPWRLNNYYDRPIPRRIAEDLGVDREAFGQQKKATAVSTYDDIYFSSALITKMADRWNNVKKLHKKEMLLGNALHSLYKVQIFIINKFTSVVRRMGYKNYNLKYRFIPRRYARAIDKWSLLAQWSTEELKNYYNIISKKE